MKNSFISINYKIFLMLIVSLALFACDNNGHNHHGGSDANHDHSKHNHGPLEITTLGDNITAPSLKATITEDSAHGWNLHLSVENFNFTPEKVGQASEGNSHAANEGHAHLYVDGLKFSRIYSPWHHLTKLRPGQHTLEITLNANNHSPLSYQGQPIAVQLELHQKP